MDISNLIDLIPGLPSDLGLECLTRLPHAAHRVALQVCSQWHRLLQSEDFYKHRKKFGHTRKVTCLLQARQEQPLQGKPASLPSPYGISIFDPDTMTWDWVLPVPDYPFGLPMFSQLASCDGNLVLMGGWDPTTYQPLSALFVYDFRTSLWRRGKDMLDKRSFFALGSGLGRVYVAGGHDENKNALSSAWAYDPSSDEWAGLAQMARERDECEGVVIGDEFWVVSGYGTERQGLFDGSAEVLDIGSGKWREVNGCWEEGGCPRSCVGVGKDGKLVNFRGLDPRLKAGLCGVLVGSRVLLSGSDYDGAPHGFYLVDMEEGQHRKLRRISVPHCFSGFVQSGCCVEI
ncbi:hypothetical protein VNO78_11316 [Psophocarpus tetragonolobus]|uniref:F-box domain-containing protein n=1 Tax=Psophocarpus tetragonolobus TaxID=3891 RepID=A0AAN9SP07_PSOTE